tara:strand:- start:5020 stop:5754 length:735 start_codon:yes stop_codon:yes gene_type:complete
MKIENKNNILLQAQNISLRNGQKNLLTDISIKISAGEIVTIIGPNGAGKTTLLRVLLGLISPNSGKILKKNNLKIAYLPQKINVDPILPLSVKRIMNLNGDVNIKNIKTALEQTGVSSLINKPLSHISGGEFQRVMLSRALLRAPELLVLDEPVKEVDYLGRTEIYKLIGTLSKKIGFGVLMVSHDLHVVMASTNRVICLNQHICCEGQVKDVSKHPEYLRLFGIDSDGALAVYSHDHDHTHNI